MRDGSMKTWIRMVDMGVAKRSASLDDDYDSGFNYEIDGEKIVSSAFENLDAFYLGHEKK